MRKLKIAFAALAALIGLAMAPTNALADCVRGNCWGAVAYGPNGAWAYAVNMPNRISAQNAALARCRGRCTRTLSFANSCGAFATGQGTGWGWGSGPNRGYSVNRALAECRARTTGCTLRVWACTQR